MKPNLPKSLLLAAAVLTGTTLRADITVKGSDTLVILAQRWAEVYMQQHADIKIQVTGGGSGVGLAALQNQQTDLCNASRKIKAKEIAACIKAFGKRPTEYKVALDGISLYIHESNPVKALSLDQLALIFTGKVTNWKAVGGADAPIVLYSRENSSGTYEFFKEHVLEGLDFASSAQTMPGTAAILQAVAKDPNGIGYGGAAYASGVKVVNVSKNESSSALPPSTENVTSMKYPISRYLYIYVNPALDKGPIAAYLDWIRGDEGQSIVKDIGYFPLPSNLRKP